VRHEDANDPNQARRLWVLVADDDEDFRAAMQETLVELGCVCVTAKDGEEAWRLQCAMRFDVLVCDWMMPGMNGLEVCRRTRRLTGETYTYVILMTGLADKAHLIEGLREGADEYLPKPVDVDELHARLASARRVIEHDRQLCTRNARLVRESERAFLAARADPLTRLGNRLRLDEDLAALAARASRYGHRYCAALCDIDHFKRYNDTYGHLAGDEALRRVAQAMQRSLRAGDALYRFGGEEFLAILPEQSLNEAAIAIDRLGATVASLRIRHEENAPFGVVTISAGVAELVLESGASHEDWIRRADTALYRAKAEGRNRVVLARREDEGTPVPGASCSRLAAAHVAGSSVRAAGVRRG
jgi:diguanylate cyclase (GGDEF)-like protein